MLSSVQNVVEFLVRCQTSNSHVMPILESLVNKLLHLLVGEILDEKKVIGWHTVLYGGRPNHNSIVPPWIRHKQRGMDFFKNGLCSFQRRCGLPHVFIFDRVDRAFSIQALLRLFVGLFCIYFCHWLSILAANRTGLVQELSWFWWRLQTRYYPHLYFIRLQSAQICCLG